jgi:hypothetical protein
MAIDLEIDQSWQDHLPECLQRRDDGAIVVAGHRVTLFAFLEAIEELGQSSIPVTLSALSDLFPSVATETIASVLQFVALNPVAIGHYRRNELLIAQRNAADFPYIGPSLESLRQRRSAGK